MNSTITVRRPRVRELTERFESKVLPLFKRRTEAVGDLLPELYLHGLSTGYFDLALRGFLGEGAPLSASSIQRLKARFELEYQTWKQQVLGHLEVVYMWADGLSFAHYSKTELSPFYNSTMFGPHIEKS